MELPVAALAPGGTDHAAVFRDLFDNQGQFRDGQYYETGLIVFPTQKLSGNLFTLVHRDHVASLGS